MKLEREVNEVPSEIEGPVRYWVELGPRASDEAQDIESQYFLAGVYFFDSDGACLSYVPIASEGGGCQDVVFSPDGRRFVLVIGSGIRQDMFFKVYGEGMKMMGIFTGVRDQLVWIDETRFVMTRIDDEDRDGRAVDITSLSYTRLSVVMYDMATRDVTVLKEATDTQNFWFVALSEDGNAVMVKEDFVKSEADWDDEEKIETREIRVEIPGAGAR
jgi:hypothetical protein